MIGNQSVYTAIAAVRIIGRTPQTMADLYNALYYRSRRRWIVANMPQYHRTEADDHHPDRQQHWQDTVLRPWRDNNRVIL